MKTLVSWIGQNDLDAITGPANNHGIPDYGSIGDFLSVSEFDRVILLNNYGLQASRYGQWLQNTTSVDAKILDVSVQRPYDLDFVYDALRDKILPVLAPDGGKQHSEISYLLSSGTKAMSSALLLIACSDLDGDVYYNWEDDGVPDPADRYVMVKWPQRFSLSLFAAKAQADLSPIMLCSPDGREISRSPIVGKVYEQARKVAGTDMPVLIQGETGSGKEVLTDYIVRQSSRNNGPRIDVNCGAIPENLIDSELFGYVKGAFTDAKQDNPGKLRAANKGTIFLDEIGDLPQSVQVRLLRFLQEGEVTPVGSAESYRIDVRVIAASHRDLRELVRKEKFREDLYYRLAGYPLFVPALRDRPEDLRLLVDEILNTDKKARGEKTRFEEPAWRVLKQYSWPGNIRELQNIVRRCAIDAKMTPAGRTVSADLVRKVIGEQGMAQDNHVCGEETPDRKVDIGRYLVDLVRSSDEPFVKVVERLEAQGIAEAIRQEGSQSKAADLLGYSASNLSNKKKRLQGEGVWGQAEVSQSI